MGKWLAVLWLIFLFHNGQTVESEVPVPPVTASETANTVEEPEEEAANTVEKPEEEAAAEEKTALETETETDAVAEQEKFSYQFCAEYEWQEVYQSMLTEVRKKNAEPDDDYLPSEGYYLYDIDKDGIPELLLEFGGCEAEYYAEVYTYRDGGVRYLGAIGTGHTGFYTWEGENAMLARWGHMGCAVASRISIAGDEITVEGIFAENINNAQQDVWYTDMDELVPGCVGLMQYPIELDLPVVSYERVMEEATGRRKTVKEKTSDEEVKETLLSVVRENGMVYGAPGDCFGGDTGYVSFEEYCGPEMADAYNDMPFEIVQYAWVDVNGDGKMEMVLQMLEGDRDNKSPREIRVILSLQDDVVYAYSAHYRNDHLVCEDGVFYWKFREGDDYAVKFLFEKDECFQYCVAEEEHGEEVMWIQW